MQPVSIFQWRYTVVTVGLSLVMVAAHGQVAFSQNNAARNAAGYMILQNNRTQQELRETKQELREIKEGLGIESTSSGDSTANPAILALAMGVLLALIAGVIWGLRESLSCERHIRAGDFTKYRRAYEWRVTFLAFALGFSPWFTFDPRFQWLYMPGLFLTLSIGVVLTREGRLKKRFDKATAQYSHSPVKAGERNAKVGQAVNKMALIPHQSFVRLPTGEIEGPGEKANIRVLAKQGKYPPGTQWSDTANGPWETLVDEVAVTPVLGIWIRTPDGRSGGPYTKDQIRKAIATGKLAANAQAASTPSGPWRSIGSFSG
jgi:hypothetical protein